MVTIKFLPKRSFMTDKNYTLELTDLVKGEPKTIKKVYNILFPKVLSFIRLNRGTEEDAKEVFQNAIFQIIVRTKTKNLIIKSSLDGYIYVVCRNLWFQELKNRKKEVRNDIFLNAEEKIEKEISSILFQERWDLFEEKLDLLSTNCKEILKEFFKKVPYSKIVKKFNYSNENTAFQRVFKCKKKLADLVKNDTRYKDLI